MSIKQIRLSSQAKEQLIRLKSRTEIPADSNVEMSWHVFGGEYHELYSALLKERCTRDGLATDSETLNRQFRLHLHRGISYLATPNKVRNIADLVGMAV